MLTNGVVYQFYSDVEKPNRMDDKPFFTFSMDAIRPHDVRTLEKFAKASFDIEKIVQEAGYLKLQSLIRTAVEQEFAAPSDEFVALIARKVREGRITSSVKENFGKLLAMAIAGVIRDQVNQRLSSALNAAAPGDAADESEAEEPAEIVTTEEEISGFRIVQAIASRFVHPKRIVMRDAKSYCAILLDDNNRKTIARLHFNGLAAKYLGTFAGKDETRHQIADLTEIYRHSDRIEARLKELEDRAAA